MYGGERRKRMMKLVAKNQVYRGLGRKLCEMQIRLILENSSWENYTKAILSARNLNIHCNMFSEAKNI